MSDSQPPKRPVGRPRKSETPEPIDRHIGRLIRRQRMLMGLSQEKLGEAIGLTFQQIQKYEKGTSQLGASRLYQVSQALGVSISYFFEAAPDTTRHYHVGLLHIAEDNLNEYVANNMLDPMKQRETLDLINSYYRLPKPFQKRFLDLIKLVAVTGEHQRNLTTDDIDPSDKTSD